jgi:long-subunit fatty acid transport protein
VTTDADWHEAVNDMDHNTSKIYTRDSVLNYAIGTEYYLTSSIPLRAGYFTNNDATPLPSSSKTDQPDHVDYKGVTLFLAWAQPNSQVSAGAVVQKGTGKSQKEEGKTITQSIDAFAYTLGFSATHSF